MEYLFKIQIKGITNPTVCREVMVPARFTFHRFHDVIQVAFDWNDLYSFEFRDKVHATRFRIGTPSDDDFEYSVDKLDASRVKLSDIITDKGTKFFYIYDFGDFWVHEITVEDIRFEKLKKAVCLSGNGNDPPDNCGGARGYERIKEVFRTMPYSEEANRFREREGMTKDEIWDPYIFFIDVVNDALQGV